MKKTKVAITGVSGFVGSWLKTELENKLGDPAVYADKNIFLKTEQDYASIQKKVEQLQAQYEVLFEQLLELEN